MKFVLLFVCCSLLYKQVHSFTTPLLSRNSLKTISLHKNAIAMLNGENYYNLDRSIKIKSSEDLNLNENDIFQVINENNLAIVIPVLFAILPFIPIDSAFAAASDWGILAGRTASLIHPISNFAFFGTSLYSAYLGFQWRNLRDIGEQIKELNKELPVISTGQAKSPFKDTINSINTEISSLASNPESSSRIELLKSDLNKLKSNSDIDDRIQELSTKRKDLLSANLKDKHHLTGSILLGGGVTVSILGAFNTYMRAGKLFPGPHLYAGMGITILWAIAASLVPAMQKGNATARNAHIIANIINIGLFAWQIPTGIEITLKVIEKTSW